MVQEADFQWTSAPAKVHASSPGVQRHFCEHCGTPLAFSAEYLQGMMDITALSLDDPDQFPPQIHINNENRLGWFDVADDLPRHAGFPPQE